MLGSGIIQGLAVTAKNLVGSFHDPKRYVTTEYPEVKTVLPENYRNFPILISETAEDPMGTMRCVACQICEKECPPQCIYIEKSKDKKPDATGKMQVYPVVFDIDVSVCSELARSCVEVCPFDAIKMDHVFEIAAPEPLRRPASSTEQALAKPNSYYHQIHPEPRRRRWTRPAGGGRTAKRPQEKAERRRRTSPRPPRPTEPPARRHHAGIPGTARRRRIPWGCGAAPPLAADFALAGFLVRVRRAGAASPACS